MKEMCTSKLNEAQKSLYYIVMNMKLQGKISPEGITHFEMAIEALSDNEISYEESKTAIYYLQKMKDGYIEGYGYEAHPLPEYYAIETAINALYSKNKAVILKQEQTSEIKLMQKLQKIEQIIKDHDNDNMPEDYFYIDKIREALNSNDIVLDSNQEKNIIDENLER